MAPIILKSILESPSNQTLAVFDLDSTLYNVTPRTQKILFDFSKLPPKKQNFLPFHRQMEKVQVLSSDWGIKESLLRANINAPQDFYEEVRQFWVQHFFSNAYLKYDQPYFGAVDFVQTIYKKKIPVYYLTGRDRPDMLDGTLQSLDQHNFPLMGVDEALYMKPHKKSAEDEDYKLEVLKKLSTQFKNIFFFENEPVIINRVLQNLPDIKIVFLDTVHSGREQVPEHLWRIPGEYRF